MPACNGNVVFHRYCAKTTAGGHPVFSPPLIDSFKGLVVGPAQAELANLLHRFGLLVISIVRSAVTRSNPLYFLEKGVLF
jgi:hypothetical protein